MWPDYVVAGPFMFFSGQMGRTRDGAFVTRYADAPNVGDRANTAFDWVSDMEAPVGAQGIAIYERYRALLADEGSDHGHFLRYHIYQRDKHFFSVFDRVRRTYEPKPPASTAVGLGRFEAGDRATLCIDSIAPRGNAEPTFGARTVLPGASQHVAAATFSHVVNAGPFLFLAGQIPIDASKPGSPLIRNYEDIPEEGRFLRVGRSHEDARNGPIASQTWFTYDLIRQHLEASGSSLDRILNLTVYLQDMRDFGTFHRVHEHFFRSGAPALTVIEAAEVGHKGTLIEIEPTAVIPGHDVERRVTDPAGWHAPARMSALVEAGGLAFFSGIPGNGDGAEEQIRNAMSALRSRLSAAGRRLSDVVSLTVYLRDIDEFPAIERVLEQGFGSDRPALTVLEVPAVSPARGARISLTAIGWFGD
jgi:2-iminobutanoate/2-iminopropanoate deaminase